MIIIKQLNKDDLDLFFEYLGRHLNENGRFGNPVFQPLSVNQSKLTPQWKKRFENCLVNKSNDKDWRKIWVARTAEKQIVGHIDIRPYPDQNTGHRVLLGMGVDSKFRNMRIGQKLIEFIIEYCKADPDINWIDLQVLSNNKPAVKLYEKMKFKEIGRVNDMFRIESVSYDYIHMTLNIVE